VNNTREFNSALAVIECGRHLSRVNHQLGETLVMIQTWMTIQVQAIIQKWIEKGIALPFVILLHQQDMIGASWTCLAGTQIPPAYECSANGSLKCVRLSTTNPWVIKN
jgi:hypothetical protein